MQNQANKTLRAFQTVDNTPVSSKSSDGKFIDLYGNKQYNIAIYCRLSVDDIDKIKTGDESESIQNQKLLLLDYAMNQGWSVYKVYSDADYSGLDQDRPAFNQMIADAERGLFNIVLCKHQSRFTRDLEMVEKYIHGLFVRLGVRFVSVVDHVDTQIRGNKKARQINALINEWYVEDLSDNIRAVFRKKMEAGQFLGPFAPYGYQKDPNDRHRLVVDKEAAAIVREIYRLYLNGFGYQAIRESLAGVPTPSAYKKAQGLNYASPHARPSGEEGGHWANNTLRRILTNRTYTGCLIQGREKKVSYKSKKVVLTPESEWVVIEDNHTPVINRKDFDAVQRLIESKRTVHRQNKGDAGRTYPLAGKVYCRYCGHIMHKAAPTRDGAAFYLRCSLSARSKRRECVPNYIRADHITQAIESKIREHIADYIQNEKNAALLKNSLADNMPAWKRINEKRREQASAHAKCEEISKMITSAYTDKCRGILSENDFIRLKKEFDDGLSKQRGRYERLAAEINALQKQIDAEPDADAMVKKYSQFACLTHEIANDFVDSVRVGACEIEIRWRF